MPKKITFYQKSTCVSCQKAQAVLEGQGVSLAVVDITKTPPPKALLTQLLKTRGVKNCLNSRSAIYKERGLGKNLPSPDEALALMAEDPNLIKRPVVVVEGGPVLMGFDLEAIKNALSS